MGTTEIIGLAVAAFVSTNLDDLFLLLVLFADGRSRAWNIVVGQYTGVGALVILSLIIASGMVLLPSRWIGLLGIFPLLLGVKDLVQLRRTDGHATGPAPLDGSMPGGRNWLAIALVTFANGGDNIGVYAPLFATTRGIERVVIISVFGVMIAVWCALAVWLLKVGQAVTPRKRALQFVTAVVLILLGIFILSGVFRENS